MAHPTSPDPSLDGSPSASPPPTALPFKPRKMDVILETPRARVAEVTLGPHSDTPWHLHSGAAEVCYCLEGELTCEVTGEGASDAASDDAGRRPVVLRQGDRARFAAGLAHRLSNRAEAPCRFLVIHGAGPFDFVPTAEA